MQVLYVSVFSAALFASGTYFIALNESGLKPEAAITGESVSSSHRNAVAKAESLMKTWSGVSSQVVNINRGPYGRGDDVSSRMSVVVSGPNRVVTVYTWAPPVHESRDHRRFSAASNDLKANPPRGRTAVGILGATGAPSGISGAGSAGVSAPAGSLVAATIIGE